MFSRTVLIANIIFQWFGVGYSGAVKPKGLIRYNFGIIKAINMKFVTHTNIVN